MTLKPLYIGKESVGDRFISDDVTVFFGNKNFNESTFERIFSQKILKLTKQVHGDKVIRTDPQADTRTTAADGMVTSHENLALGVYSADCLPVMFYNQTRKTVASCHAGWRGVENGIAALTYKQVTQTPEDVVHIWVGPHIKQNSFEVDKDVAERLKVSSPNANQYILQHPSKSEKSLVELAAIVIDQLVSCGATKDRICISSVNTFESPLHYSYRREGPTGRLISFISLLGV